MLGPQHLLAIGQRHRLVGLPAVRGGEGGMPGRVPVLGGEGMREAPGQQPVDHRHHRIALRHRQRAARHEGRLHIDDAEDVGRGIDRDGGHGRAPGPAARGYSGLPSDVNAAARTGLRQTTRPGARASRDPPQPHPARHHEPATHRPRLASNGMGRDAPRAARGPPRMSSPGLAQPRRHRLRAQQAPRHRQPRHGRDQPPARLRRRRRDAGRGRQCGGCRHRRALRPHAWWSR